MSLQTWQETLVAQHNTGTPFNTFTTAKTVIEKTSLYTLPANYLQIGKVLRISVLAALSNIVTTPGTVVFQVMLGGTSVFTTGNIQMNATAHTNLPVWINILLTCQTVGATAKFLGMGRVQGIQPTLTAAQVDSVNTGGIFSAPATAPAQGAGFDSSVALVLDFFCGFSISNAGNQITIYQYVVEALN